jgi:hypothetical protein
MAEPVERRALIRIGLDDVRADGSARHREAVPRQNVGARPGQKLALAVGPLELHRLALVGLVSIQQTRQVGADHGPLKDGPAVVESTERPRDRCPVLECRVDAHVIGSIGRERLGSGGVGWCTRRDAKPSADARDSRLRDSESIGALLLRQALLEVLAHLHFPHLHLGIARPSRP